VKIQPLLVLGCLLVLGQLALLLESRMADVAGVGPKSRMDSEMIFDIAIFVESIIAVSAKIHGVVPLRGRIVYFFGEVYTLLTAHVSDSILLRMDLVDGLSVALTVSIGRVLRKRTGVQDI
jgi:hypothetical protein